MGVHIRPVTLAATHAEAVARPVRAAALSFVVAASSVCAAPATARPALVAVPGGTPLDVSVNRSLSSHNARIGERFTFRATQAVVVHGWVVIRKDALGQGYVIKAEGAGRNGRPGKLALRFHWIAAADGSTVALAAAPNRTNAAGRTRTSAITNASHLLGSASHVVGSASHLLGSASHLLGGASSLFGPASYVVLGPVGLVAGNLLGPIARHFTWGRDVTIDPKNRLAVYVSRDVHITAKRRAMRT
jgi:hypothetical protein